MGMRYFSYQLDWYTVHLFVINEPTVPTKFPVVDVIYTRDERQKYLGTT